MFYSIDRPDALNAFRPEMLDELARLLGLIEKDLSIVVVILEGRARHSRLASTSRSFRVSILKAAKWVISLMSLLE